MRRYKQEITDKNEIEKILRSAEVARIALNRKDSAPYILPMNFAYEGGIFYFHCAPVGTKLELIKEDPRISIEIEAVGGLEKAGTGNPCDWGMEYRSVIAEGSAVMLDDFEAKKAALELIVARFSDENTAAMTEAAIRAVAVFSVRAEKISAKQSD